MPGYRPPPRQVETVAKAIERELGPVPSQGLDPGVYRAVGADRNTPLGLINQAILYPLDKAALLLHLASYGIDAAIVGGTQTAARLGWISETSAGQLRRDLDLLAIVLGIEAGRVPEVLSTGLRSAATRMAALSRAAAKALPPVLLRAERVSGLPFGRMFRVVDLVQTDRLTHGLEPDPSPASSPSWPIYGSSRRGPCSRKPTENTGPVRPSRMFRRVLMA